MNLLSRALNYHCNSQSYAVYHTDATNHLLINMPINPLMPHLKKRPVCNSESIGSRPAGLVTIELQAISPIIADAAIKRMELKLELRKLCFISGDIVDMCQCFCYGLLSVMFRCNISQLARAHGSKFIRLINLLLTRRLHVSLVGW